MTFLPDIVAINIIFFYSSVPINRFSRDKEVLCDEVIFVYR